MDGTASSYRPYITSDDERGGTGRALTSERTHAPGYSTMWVAASRRPRPTTRPGQWPLCTHMELGALITAVPCARLHTRQVLWEWNQHGLVETAELVVSELMTNAITATQAIKSDYPVVLWLLSDSSRTLVAVGDASHYPPRLIDTSVDEAGGRGLMLVQALSSNWGWYATHKPRTAKIVWAELQVEAEDSQTANAIDDE